MFNKKIISILVCIFIIISNFTFTETIVQAVSDVTPPVLKNVSVDKSIVTGGDSIIVTIDATDDISGIKNGWIDYDSPSGTVHKWINYIRLVDGKWKSTISIGNNDEAGLWKVVNLTLSDVAGNYTSISRNDILSKGDFEVNAQNNIIQPISQKAITQNENWTSNIINGDLYIGPNAVLTINGPVTVNGNIYVLGAIKNYGNLTVTGSIYASSFNWGNSTLYNGTVLMLGGTNSISSMIASNNPIDIPLKLYEANNDTLVAFDGKISITGAIVPIVDLYMDNTKVDYHYNGTFNLDLDTSNKQQVNFKTVDVYGNEKIEPYTILNKYYDTNLDSAVDLVDLATVAKNYNTSKSNVNWQEQYDYNCDGVIDIYDLVKISKKIS